MLYKELHMASWVCTGLLRATVVLGLWRSRVWGDLKNPKPCSFQGSGGVGFVVEASLHHLACAT